MIGIRFYEEFTNTRKKVSEGNCIAVLAAHGDGCFDAIAAVFYQPNSPPASTKVSRAYLMRHCKRVRESRARHIHPRLFSFLD